MPENIRGDVHVTAQGVRWTYLGSRYPGTVDVTIQPPGEEPSDHTVMWVVWDAVVSGSKPLGRVTLPPASTTEPHLAPDDLESLIFLVRNWKDGEHARDWDREGLLAKLEALAGGGGSS